MCVDDELASQEHCSAVAKLICKSLHESASERPSFATIVRKLSHVRPVMEDVMLYRKRGR
eukprot:1969257-Amphidinium_carterae.1